MLSTMISGRISNRNLHIRYKYFSYGYLSYNIKSYIGILTLCDDTSVLLQVCITAHLMPFSEINMTKISGEKERKEKQGNKK